LRVGGDVGVDVVVQQLGLAHEEAGGADAGLVGFVFVVEGESGSGGRGGGQLVEHADGQRAAEVTAAVVDNPDETRPLGITASDPGADNSVTATPAAVITAAMTAHSPPKPAVWVNGSATRAACGVMPHRPGAAST